MGCKKIFLDANIILDFLNKNRINHNKAKELIYYLEVENYDIVISEDMITNIYYINKDKKQVLSFIKEVIIDSWEIVDFGLDIIKKATDYCIKNNSDLEDTLQCFCAKNNSCDIFLTSDKKFINCGIEILDYDGFLNSY